VGRFRLGMCRPLTETGSSSPDPPYLERPPKRRLISSVCVVKQSAARVQRIGLALDFVMIVLSETVLSETVLVLDGCLNCGDADR
jgi:hypothetical protein